MSSTTQVKNPTPAQVRQMDLQKEVEDAARALRKELQRSKAAAKVRNLKLAKSEFESLNKTYLRAATMWNLEGPTAAPAPAPAKAPAKAAPAKAPAKEAPAPAMSDQGWTKVGSNGKPNGSKKKPKAKKPRDAPKKKRLPPKEFIASLKRQLKVLRQRKAKAERDGKTKDAESFQRQFNRLYGMMMRAEERLRESACLRWNAQQGSKTTWADYVKAAKAAKPK